MVELDSVLFTVFMNSSLLDGTVVLNLGVCKNRNKNQQEHNCEIPSESMKVPTDIQAMNHLHLRAMKVPVYMMKEIPNMEWNKTVALKRRLR